MCEQRGGQAPGPRAAAGVPRGDVWRWSDSAGIGKLSSAPGTVAERVARTRGRAAWPRALLRASQLRPEELQIRRRSLGGLGCSHRHPTWLLQALCYCFNVALASCTPRAPPGCPQASCCYLVALGRCIPRTPLEYPQSLLVLQGGFGHVYPEDPAWVSWGLLHPVQGSFGQVPPRVLGSLLRVIDCVWYQAGLPFSQVCLSKP